MISAGGSDGPRVLYCHCAFTELAGDAAREAALKALLQSGAPFEAVPDLCELAARHDGLLADLAAGEAPVIVACHERAVRALFAQAGAPLPQAGPTFVNLRAEAPDAAAGRLRKLLGRRRDDCACADLEAIWRRLSGRPEGAWVPWFPVIDYDRCAGCRQCLNFCIFGVYELAADGKVAVRNPAACKTNCPACARVCPNAAVIFPKHPAGPIDGSDEVSPGEPVRVDLAALTAGDVYETLRRRESNAKRRFSGEPAGAEAPGGKAACACSRTGNILARLGIPADVVESLDPDEVRRLERRAAPPPAAEK